MSKNATDQNSRHLAPSSDAIALMRYDARKKSIFVAYLFWLFLGWIGGHRFYLDNTGSAIIMSFVTILSLMLSVVNPGFIFGFLIIVIWAIIDIFLIPGMASRANSRLVDRIRRKAIRL